MFKKFTNRLKNLVVSINNSKILFYSFLYCLFAFSCANEKANKIEIDIYPYSFNLFCSKNELDTSMKRQGIELQYEDSHTGSDKGVYFNYFGSKENGIDYYIELYSKDNRLQGIKAVLYSTKLSDSTFFKIIDKSILPNLKYNATNNNVLFDTIREQKAEITERYQYTIYIRTKEIDKITKATTAGYAY